MITGELLPIRVLRRGEGVPPGSTAVEGMDRLPSTTWSINVGLCDPGEWRKLHAGQQSDKG